MGGTASRRVVGSQPQVKGFAGRSFPRFSAFDSRLFGCGVVGLKKKCAWCGAEMGDTPGSSKTGKPITHGICEPCAAKLWGGVGTRLDEFLATLGVPTLLVDGTGRVDEANQEAMDMVEKPGEEVRGRFQGEVFDCWNATLPGGCGCSVLCSACVVRRAVLDTYDSGTSLLGVPVVLKVRENGKGKELKFALTTEKVGDRVLVRVHPGGPKQSDG